MSSPVIATWTNENGLFAEVGLPQISPAPDGYHKHRWGVPLYDPYTEKIGDRLMYQGEVFIGHTGKITVVGVPNALETADDARRLAAALLAAAETFDTLLSQED